MRVKVGNRGAVFLDRDGTINVRLAGNYVTSAQDLVLLPGAAEAVAEINLASRRAIVLTNQRGIALGRMTEDDLAVVHGRMEQLVDEATGGMFAGIIHCPHGVGECDCRKPKPGMFHEAASRWPDLDLSESVMIGDSASDVKAARAAGVAALRIGDDVPDLLTAVREALCWMDHVNCG